MEWLDTSWLENPTKWANGKSGWVHVDEKELVKAIIYHDDRASIVETITANDTEYTRLWVSDMGLAYSVISHFMMHMLYKRLRGY